MGALGIGFMGVDRGGRVGWVREGGGEDESWLEWEGGGMGVRGDVEAGQGVGVGGAGRWVEKAHEWGW